MAVNIPCPNCNEQALHRSRSRNHIEKFKKRIFPYRLYRCHQCQWRGWISNRRVKGQSAFIQLGLFYLGVVILSFLVALALWTLLH